MSPVKNAVRTLSQSLTAGLHAFSSIVVYTSDYSFSENTVVQPVLIDKLRKSSVRFF